MVVLGWSGGGAEVIESGLTVLGSVGIEGASDVVMRGSWVWFCVWDWVERLFGAVKNVDAEGVFDWGGGREGARVDEIGGLELKGKLEQFVMVE